jgi:excisionase family DNA binding protein
MTELALTVPDALVEAIAVRVAELMADRLAAPAAEPWIGVPEAAEHIGAPVSRVYDLVARRELVPGRDGRRIAFRRSQLDAYMEREASP